jgi:hypothetical protein
MIYNHTNNAPINDIVNQIKSNLDKTQTKVIEADFVKEFLNNIKDDDTSKQIKEIILLGEKYFDSVYTETIAKFKE